MRLKIPYSKDSCLSVVLNVRRLSTKPYIVVQGVQSRCDDGLHVILMDYDRMLLDSLISDIKMLQCQFGLGTAHIIESSPGKYHVAFPEKHPRWQALEILEHSGADPMHVLSAGYNGYGCWHLRVGEKPGSPSPKYVQSVPSMYQPLEISRAHVNWLKSIGATDESLGGASWDIYSTPVVVFYRTRVY